MPEQQQETTRRQRRHASPGRRSGFGDVLRRLRRFARLTQSDLAERIGLQGHAFLSQVENGRLPLPAHWLIPIAAELGVNAQRLAWVYVAMEMPDLYEAIGGHKPPDLDPDTLLRMLDMNPRGSASGAAHSPAQAETAGSLGEPLLGPGNSCERPPDSVAHPCRARVRGEDRNG